MTTADRVRQLLKEKGIRFSHIERDLGFSNGYIGQLNKELPTDRLFAIAKYIGVSPEYLMTGEVPEAYYEDEEAATIAQEILSSPELRALMSAARDCSPDDMRMVAEILRRMKGTNPNG